MNCGCGSTSMRAEVRSRNSLGRDARLIVMLTVLQSARLCAA
jgi:hypothetical protein